MDKIYTSPRIEIQTVHLEEGLATGSAIIRPGASKDNPMQDQWIEDDQDTKQIDWF
ncbi:hypothetical protein [Sphingobacterium cellulitidis]|uniref:hypothetical protein n=1 Tax=Sphingobacterium cellulitidis TaxID=1768011 RepID=UPI003C7BBB2E